MKNFLNKMDFHYTYIIMAFGLVLTGHFINLIAFTSLIIIHEFGHVITATIYKYRIKKITIYPYGGITEFDTLVNTKIEKDLHYSNIWYYISTNIFLYNIFFI